MKFDKACLTYFLEHQNQLFPEEVAETMEEADAFLEDCMAVVCKNIIRNFRKLSKKEEEREINDLLGLDASKHMIAVTSETSPLAKSDDYLAYV